MASWKTMWPVCLLLVACGPAADEEDEKDEDISDLEPEVEIEVVLDKKLNVPRDLAFNPQAPGELWVVNQGNESVTVIDDVRGESPSATKYEDDITGPHFLAQPVGIAFGDNGNMATIHDTDKKTQGPNGTPGDFMGPTLWTSDLTLFDAGHASHLDMLHNSPLGKGIAWESGNAYWVFDAWHQSVTRYDFQADHGLGGSDHTDGIISRYLEGEVKRGGKHPSHLWYDHSTDELYIVDGGNNRILVLDTLSGARGANTAPNYDGADQFRVDGAASWELISGEEVGMVRPVGIDVLGDTLYISDLGLPGIHTFTLDGEHLSTLELEQDINGIAVDEDGTLYFVDPTLGQVVRVSGI